MMFFSIQTSTKGGVFSWHLTLKKHMIVLHGPSLRSLLIGSILGPDIK